MIVAPEAKRDLVLRDEPELGHLGGASGGRETLWEKNEEAGSEGKGRTVKD